MTNENLWNIAAITSRVIIAISRLQSKAFEQDRIFPSLYSRRNAKAVRYPPEEHIVLSETRAAIKVQAVLVETDENQ